MLFKCPETLGTKLGGQRGPGHTSSRRDTPRPVPLPPRPRPRPRPRPHTNARFRKERRIPGGRAEGKPPRPAPLGSATRAQPGAPSVTDAPTSVARTDRGLGLWTPWVRGRGRVCEGTDSSFNTHGAVSVSFLFLRGNLPRFWNQDPPHHRRLPALCWAGFSLFREVQTTMVCPTETRPNLMRRGDTLTRGEPSCCGAGAGPGAGVQPHFSAGCRAVHAAPPPPSCPAPLTDTTRVPCHAVGGFQAWPVLLPCPAELCSSPA